MKALRHMILPVLVLAFLIHPQVFEPLLRPLAPVGGPVIYDRGSLLHLTALHLALMLAALLPAAALAVGLAVLVTREAGAEFLPLSRALVNLGQTIPPVAVLALAVPMLGFGARPALLALFLYGMLPVFENALAGLRAVPAATKLAADAVGMTGARRLFSVELPLALPLILEGLRVSAVISLSTATLGSTVSAASLGEVIVAGLNANNLAFVVQGGVLTACLAVMLYNLIGWCISRAMRASRQAGI